MCSILELQQYPLLHYMPKMISRFSKNTINAIGYYVYGLRYPREQEYFYIGKGKGNRVFSHVKQSSARGISDPKFDIISTLRSEGGPEIDIIRHGLTEQEALLLESALIDVLGVDQIANKVKGFNSEKYGLMSPKNIEAQYKGKPFVKPIKAVCFKINRAWRRNMSALELYEMTRGNWRLSLARAGDAEFGIGLTDGVIRSIYKIHSWEKVPERSPERYRFIGYKIDEMKRYLGYSLAFHPNHRVRGPLFYLNC